MLAGLHHAGVAGTVKHFPGLGRVVGNTDTTAGVVDSVTVRGDPYLGPFAAGVRLGAPFVMISLATYQRIDPQHLAAFSPTVLGSLLCAAAVQSVSPASRALGFLAAGGDMVLTVNPSLIPAMVTAVLSRTQTDAAFATWVNRSALRVLIAKQQAGLLGGALAAGSAAGRVSVVQRGNDNGLLVRDSSGTVWSAPQTLGGQALFGPAAASVTGGVAAIPVAVTGSDRAVYLNAYTAGGSGSGWQRLGGIATSAPAVAGTTGRTDVAVRGTDGAAYVRSWTATAGWGGWTRLGGVLADGPAAAYLPDGELLVTVTGSDQQVFQNVRRGSAWSAGRVSAGWPSPRRRWPSLAPARSSSSSAAPTRACGTGAPRAEPGRDGRAWAACSCRHRPPPAPVRAAPRSSSKGRTDGSTSASAPADRSRPGPGCPSEAPPGGSAMLTGLS